MRLLTKDELNLVAGGWGSSEPEMNGATVWGTRWNNNDWYDPSWYSYEIGGGGGGGSGGGEPEPEAEPTPCVEASPAGVSLQSINNAALAASNAIAALNDETYEYGVILYELNGVIGMTSVFTQNYTDEIDWNAGIAEIPDGARILGLVHNHPDEGGIDDRIPSPASEGGRDWASYNAVMDWSGSTRGITVDPNMLMYIYSNQDHKTHVYDKTDKSQTYASCSLQ